MGRLFDFGRCHAIDLPGHGRSPPAREASTVGDYAQNLLEASRLGELEAAVWVGWSLGAQVALEVAARLGNRLAGLVLVSGTARFSAAPGYPHGLPSAEVDALAARLKQNPRKALGRFFASWFADGELSEEERRRQTERLLAKAPDPKASLGALSALAQFDGRPLLQSILAPVLLIHGGQDAIVPLGASAYLADHLPRARLEVLPAVGHAPLLSRPDRLCELFSAFLKEPR